MAQLLRGDPAHAAASSLIVPCNANLVLRGTLGQRLLAMSGPVPQNELLRMAPVAPGTVVPVQAGVREGPARWYVSAAFPYEGSIDLTLVGSTLQEAVNVAFQEGQVPVAVPFFLDGTASAETVQAIAQLMFQILGGIDVLILTDDPFHFDALQVAQARLQSLSVQPPEASFEFSPIEEEGAEAAEASVEEAAAAPETEEEKPRKGRRRRGA